MKLYLWNEAKSLNYGIAGVLAESVEEARTKIIDKFDAHYQVGYPSRQDILDYKRPLLLKDIEEEPTVVDFLFVDWPDY